MRARPPRRLRMLSPSLTKEGAAASPGTNEGPAKLARLGRRPGSVTVTPQGRARQALRPALGWAQPEGSMSGRSAAPLAPKAADDGLPVPLSLKRVTQQQGCRPHECPGFSQPQHSCSAAGGFKLLAPEEADLDQDICKQPLTCGMGISGRKICALSPLWLSLLVT